MSTILEDNRTRFSFSNGWSLSAVSGWLATNCREDVSEVKVYDSLGSSLQFAEGIDDDLIEGVSADLLALLLAKIQSFDRYTLQSDAIRAINEVLAGQGHRQIHQSHPCKLNNGFSLDGLRALAAREAAAAL